MIFFYKKFAMISFLVTTGPYPRTIVHEYCRYVYCFKIKMILIAEIAR